MLKGARAANREFARHLRGLFVVRLPADRGLDLGQPYGMGGDSMGMGDMGEAMSSPLLGGAGDEVSPHYLVNGREPESPTSLRGTVGQRERLRIVKAGSDTAYLVGPYRGTAGHPA